VRKSAPGRQEARRLADAPRLANPLIRRRGNYSGIAAKGNLVSSPR
jgi:hypothetical protein